MTPELIAAEACARTVWSLAGTTDARAEHISKACVEAISAAELVIVPAAKIAALLGVERAARALLGSEDAMAAALAGDVDRAAKFDPWPEADALVAALREVVA